MHAFAALRALICFAFGALMGLSAAAAQTLTIPLTLTKPAGDGPFPAVVIMHDCSGLGPRSSGSPWRWSSQLSHLGYVTLWPDSLSTRGFPHGLCQDPKRPRVSFARRAEDAYAALAHLRSLPFVDPRRIAVMGGSHGGSSTLAAIVDDSGATPARQGPGFAAAVALYPGCGFHFGGWSVTRARGLRGPVTGYSGVFKPTAPTLILIGELDDWTPAEACRRLAEAAHAAGYPVTIKIYPGAHHAFDSPLPQRYLADRININAPNGRGATTAGNPAAWADAITQVQQFLAEHLASK